VCVKLEHKAFDIRELQANSAHILRQLSAAARDPAIEALSAHATLPDYLVATLDLLQHVRLDLANFTLDQCRPLLRQHALETERARLRQALDAGLLATARTAQWLQAAATAQEGAPQPHAPGIAESRQATFETLYYAAVEDLLVPAARDPESWPETFEVRVRLAHPLLNGIPCLGL
jgi:hypothetical protein